MKIWDVAFGVLHSHPDFDGYKLDESLGEMMGRPILDSGWLQARLRACGLARSGLTTWAFLRKHYGEQMAEAVKVALGYGHNEYIERLAEREGY